MTPNKKTGPQIAVLEKARCLRETFAARYGTLEVDLVRAAREEREAARRRFWPHKDLKDRAMSQVSQVVDADGPRSRYYRSYAGVMYGSSFPH